jgi:hypothetical protein
LLKLELTKTELFEPKLLNLCLYVGSIAGLTGWHALPLLASADLTAETLRLS